MKPLIIPKKSDKQIEEEIDSILTGKDHSNRGKMLRTAAKTLRVLHSEEDIKKMFIKEYKKKYGELQSGKKTLEQIKQEAIEDSRKAKGE